MFDIKKVPGFDHKDDIKGNIHAHAFWTVEVKKLPMLEPGWFYPPSVTIDHQDPEASNDSFLFIDPDYTEVRKGAAYVAVYGFKPDRLGNIALYCPIDVARVIRVIDKHRTSQTLYARAITRLHPWVRIHPHIELRHDAPIRS